MEFQTFVRKPFRIQAIQITEENIELFADLIGDNVVRKEDNGTHYFLANRQLVRTINRVKVGYWVTKMNEQYRVYVPEVFDSLFCLSSKGLEQICDLVFAGKGVADAV